MRFIGSTQHGKIEKKNDTVHLNTLTCAQPKPNQKVVVAVATCSIIDFTNRSIR